MLWTRQDMGHQPSRRSRIQGFEAHARAPELTPRPNPLTYVQASRIVPAYLIVTFFFPTLQ